MSTWIGPPRRRRLAQHLIRERGLDKKYYLDLILALVREHGPVPRDQVTEVLLPSLPDRMTEEQKKNKVKNLLHELRKAGKIKSGGRRKQPYVELCAGRPEGVTVRNLLLDNYYLDFSWPRFGKVWNFQRISHG